MACHRKGRKARGTVPAIVLAALVVALSQTVAKAPETPTGPTAEASAAVAGAPEAERGEAAQSPEEVPELLAETAEEAPSDPSQEGSAGSFSADDGSREAHANFAELDGSLRCGPVFAVLDADHMGQGERPDISSVKPTGWKQKRYDFIDNGGWLWNRCHLLGDQLWNEDYANWKNLVTGTRQMNVEGMLPVENEVASHLRSTGHRVLYQVTPEFVGDEAVCRTVRMEASCTEGDLEIDERVENVQDGVAIDYSDGSSRAA